MADDVHRAGALGEGLRAQAQQRYEEAERLLRQALGDEEPDAGYYLGELLIELDRSAEAVRMR
jgi:tetratricopeptide (TPR) repeat protein